MNSINHQLLVKSDKAPVVEFDPACGAVYVRFNSRAVAKTVERSAEPIVITVDLDRNGEVVGVEAIGFDEFTLQQLLTAAKVRADHIDLTKARFRGTPHHVESEERVA